MDGSGFDELVARAAGAISRRRLGAAVGGGLAGLAGANAVDAKPKKKKKKPTCKRPNTKCGKKGCCKSNQVCVTGACKPACQFTKTATRWTLQADCSTTSTIDIPDGVTLDGNGKTITAAGSPLDYVAYEGASARAVVLARAGSRGVENLTIRGSEMYFDDNDMIPDTVVGLAVHQATSRVAIADVIVENFPDSLYAVIGMRFSGTGTTADVSRCTVRRVSTVGISVDGRDGDSVQVNLDQVDVNTTTTEFNPWYRPPIAFTGAEGTITRSSLQADLAAIYIIDASTVTVANNVLRTGRDGIVVAYSTVDTTDNEIVGPGAGTFGGSYGIRYFGGTGTVARNKISGFLEPGGELGPEHDSCGIRQEWGAVISLSDNTYPPPGNLRDECDYNPD